MSHDPDTAASRADLLATPFVASFIGRARPGDPARTTPGTRTGVWTHWAVTALTTTAGARRDPTAVLVLPGSTPGATRSPAVLPIPAHRLHRPDPHFADRIAQAGNTLLTARWIHPEISACIRAILHVTGDSSALTGLLDRHHQQLADTVTTLTRLAAALDTGGQEPPTADFTAADVTAYFPAVTGLHITHDLALRALSGGNSAHRAGVWQLHTIGPDGRPCTLGTVTPRPARITASGDAATDSPAALLVRGLQLTRLLTHTGRPTMITVPTIPARTAGPALRLIPARHGQRTPAAAPAAATLFIATHPDPATAWTHLTAWAATSGAILTVTEAGFTAAHARARSAADAGQPPARPDVDILLPTVWDRHNRVARATFARPSRPVTTR
jgi:hypothetical protein